MRWMAHCLDASNGGFAFDDWQDEGEARTSFDPANKVGARIAATPQGTNVQISTLEARPCARRSRPSSTAACPRRADPYLRCPAVLSRKAANSLPAPMRASRAVGQFAPHGIDHAQGLRRARQIPVRAPFIGRLVITVVGILLADRRAARLPPLIRSSPSSKDTAGTPTLAKEKWSER
jgi:hypothetical protein